MKKNILFLTSCRLPHKKRFFCNLSIFYIACNFYILLCLQTNIKLLTNQALKQSKQIAVIKHRAFQKSYEQTPKKSETMMSRFQALIMQLRDKVHDNCPDWNFLSGFQDIFRKWTINK